MRRVTENSEDRVNASARVQSRLVLAISRVAAGVKRIAVGRRKAHDTIGDFADQEGHQSEVTMTWTGFACSTCPLSARMFGAERSQETIPCGSTLTVHPCVNQKRSGTKS